MREIITGSYPGGGFVFMGSMESMPQLARRWLNYGFNDYVDGRYSSLYDFIKYVVNSKATDERGLWIRAWLEYGYTLGILYYEVLHPDLKPELNGFRKDSDLFDVLNIDYTRFPPGHGGYESWELYDTTNLYSIVRVAPDYKGTYKTVDFWHSGTEYKDVMDSLSKLGYPDCYELVSFFYWKKGAKI